MTQTPRRFLAALLAVTAFAAAGCGSSSNSSNVTAASYVKSVCTAATTWKNAIQSAGAQLETSVSSKSPAKAKAAYVSLVSAFVNATAAAQSELSSAGSPSVADGKKISSTLVGVFSNAKQSLTQAAADANNIPTTDAKAFQTAATKVQADIRNALAAMSNVTPETSSALRAAAAKDPTCKRLASGA